MKIESGSFENEGAIPEEFAFARFDAAQHATLSSNRNPELHWSDVPENCRSLVLICVDPDAPTVADDVNQEGRHVSKDLPRADFHHWVMVDIAPDCQGIGAGECSDGVVAKGKDAPSGPAGSRQGVNDYEGWFASDPEMAGAYVGYDGPAPPWNDERVHRYRFQLFALDVETLAVEGAFTVPEVRAAMEGHVLADAMVTGTYTLNADLR